MRKYDNSVGVLVPEILLPKNGTDMSKWAVVACDQYTSEPEYWNKAERNVGDAPSTLNLMLPEMYLDKPGEAERIERINACMKKYTENGTLESIGQGFVLVRRTVAGKTRVGLMAALDLENYDYTKGAKTLIRATEGTIVERIPPRLRIRRDAPLEMPHILVLIDDPARTVIEPLAEAAEQLKKLYDFELMQDGGHVEGWFIGDEPRINGALSALTRLADETAFRAKYGEGQPPLLFAMGDGNHSFATAKANWEEKKKNLTAEQQKDHPARYCLVELENVHDAGIVFEPIHRVVFNIDTAQLLNHLQNKLNADNSSCDIRMFECRADCMKELGQNSADAHYLPFVSGGAWGFFKIQHPAAQLPVGTLQNALDVIVKELHGSLDYVHGEDVVTKLGSQTNNTGFFLPPMNKSDLFRTVVFDGALPRKTFSMGEANEKRYYLECRRIAD